MKKLLIGAAAAALVAPVGAAVAQPAPPPPPGVAQGTAPTMMPMPSTMRPQVRVMVMNRKEMTRADLARHVAEFFARLDTNHDGYLTRDEVHSMRQKMADMHGDMEKRFADRGMAMPDRGAMFDRLDANHDGMISRQEYMAAKPDIRERRVMIMRSSADASGAAPRQRGMGMHMHGMGMGMNMLGRLFDMADSDHDGRVSLAEAQAAALAHFDRADLNHDGRITPDERQQAHNEMRARRPG